jgi:hypothetical protein
VYENTLIGELQIGPIQPLPAGHHHFDVKFSLDKNGMLTVTVDHKNENKSYAGDFRHKTTVEGDDALMMLRHQLLSMFQPVPIGSLQEVPPPPAPPAEQVVAPAGAATNAPPAQDVVPGPAPIGADGLPAGLLHAINVEVSEAQKSLLRRARKQLLKKIDDPLVDAYNDFARAVNEGRGADDLTDLVDDLEDAYGDARHSS